MPRLPSLITRWLAAIDCTMRRGTAQEDRGVKEEEMKTELEETKERRKKKVEEEEAVNADSGEGSWEIKHATSATGPLPPLSFPPQS